MHSDDHLRVAFPATENFTRVGRVAAVGLALRLGFDVSLVERLRKAVDKSVVALQGPGQIEAEAAWAVGELVIRLSNDRAEVDPQDVTELIDALTQLVDQVTVDDGTIELRITDAR